MIINTNKLYQQRKKNKLYVNNEYLKKLSFQVFNSFTKFIGLYKGITTNTFIKYVRHILYARFIKSLLQFVKAKFSIGIRYIKKLVNASLKILVSIVNSRLLQGSNGYKSFAIFLAIIGTLVITLSPQEELTRESVSEMLKPEEDLKQMFYKELKYLREPKVQVNSKDKISNIEEIGNTITIDNIQNLNVVNVGSYTKASVNSLYVFDSVFNSAFGYSYAPKDSSLFEVVSKPISDILSEYYSLAIFRIVPIPINLFEYLHFNSFIKEYLCICNGDCFGFVMFITKVTKNINVANVTKVTKDSNLRYSQRYRDSIDLVGGGEC